MLNVDGRACGRGPCGAGNLALVENAGSASGNYILLWEETFIIIYQLCALMCSVEELADLQVTRVLKSEPLPFLKS